MLGLIALMFVLMCVLYIQDFGLVLAGDSGGSRHADRGLLLRHRFRESGWIHRLIQQSRLRLDPFDVADRSAAHGVRWAFPAAKGVAVVLGVAAVVCVSSSVAGELLQDFKVGYILGGTPQKIQIAELIAVVVASLVMYWPLMLLHQGSISRRRRVWRPGLPAPQAGLDGHTGHGHRGRGHAVASGGGRHPVRHRHDHDAGEESHAGGGGNVSAVRDDVRDFRGRRVPLDRRLGGGAARLQRAQKAEWKMPEC